MTTAPEVGEVPMALRLAEVVPYLSVTVLACTSDEPAAAFDSLRRFLHRRALDAGRASSCALGFEKTFGEHDTIDDVGRLGDYGFEELYVSVRRLIRVPDWASSDSGITDVENQLTIALRANKLVAIRTDIVSEAQFRRWMRRQAAPYRYLPPEVMAGTFRGDGKIVWTRGVHRRRTTKADSKAVTGLRVQDALDPIDDGSYALTAAKVDYRPADSKLVLRDGVTFSASKSRLSWQRPSDFAQFLVATAEAIDALEKVLTAEEAPDALFQQLAVRETDLSRVRGAFDISVADPFEVRGEPDSDDDRVERAELLLGAVIDVRGEPNSPNAVVDVGRDGSVTESLKIKPVETADGFVLDVRLSGTPTDEETTRRIKDAMQAGDLITIYYESGHAFSNNQFAKRKLVSSPFPNLVFEDFTGFAVTREKPKPKPGQSLHDAIAESDDVSLFGWVVQRYSDGWLLCDDGAGEIADFLHLADDGTLTAIHVKAADNHTQNRRIAVTRFEQVVSQAEKNIGLLDNDVLIEQLSNRDLIASATWHNGRRICGAEFVQQLHTRVWTDKTRIVIVQPHLLHSVYGRARAAIDAGQPTRDSNSLMLLDNLLYSTRRTVTARWDDLTVIGCA